MSTPKPIVSAFVTGNRQLSGLASSIRPDQDFAEVEIRPDYTVTDFLQAALSALSG